MGRSRRPLELSTGRPHGHRWTKYRAGLVADWWRSGRTCFYCQHGFAAPQLIEVAHLISPIVAPQLAWDRGNLVPAHGAGNRRCKTNWCNLNCNWLAHNSPDAPKAPDGSDLPFTPEFMARQARQRAQFLRKRGILAPKREIPSSAPGNGRNGDFCGREW
jgi:hypothetical protein